MLQISTGKFFEYDAWETTRRAVYFSNYRLFGPERLETSAGSLQSVAGVGSLEAMTGEIVERLQKIPGGPFSGEVTATSGETLINDFAAVVSFALSITCTPDPDLARRLISVERPGLGTNLVPQKFIPRMFDAAVNWQPSDAERLQSFIADLMAMERKFYEGAMRAIRRFIVGAHRVSDDVNLAYSLFVMSMESLAQEFDGFEPTWEDYDEKKRRRVDEALQNATQATIDGVRTAILANEHAALSRRFREFTLAHLEPSFFRDEAVAAVAAVSRPDLSTALQQAYSIRSKYVHHLRDIPRLLVGIPGFHETIAIDGKPTLTFAGLVRVAHHVIRTFVARAPKTETEKFDWMKDLPGKLTMQAASIYWVGNADGFDASNAKIYLEAFMGQIIGRLLQPTEPVTDMRPVLARIEAVLPGLAKPSQRLPLLALFFLFNYYAPDEVRSATYPTLVEAYKADLETPSIVSLAAHLATGQDPDWALPEMESLHALYFRERHHANTLRLGALLEAAFTLRLAELNRLASDTIRAKELIALAVEVFPMHQGLRDYEKVLSTEGLTEISWWKILLPGVPRPTECSAGDQ